MFATGALWPDAYRSVAVSVDVSWPSGATKRRQGFQKTLIFIFSAFRYASVFSLSLSAVIVVLCNLIPLSRHQTPTSEARDPQRLPSLSCLGVTVTTYASV